MRTLLLLLLFLTLGFGAAISPVEIAEARQHCGSQCASTNHKEAAACMRKCWADFFANRKTTSKARSVLGTKTPVAKAHSVGKSRSVALAKKVRAATIPRKNKKNTKATGPVAPFSHFRHGVRTSAAQLASMGVLLIGIVAMLA